MSHVIYWLDIDGDRTGLEVTVNGFPAERFLRSHGGRLPINEFVLPGANRIEVRRSLWTSTKEDSEGGEISFKLVLAEFRNILKMGEKVVAEATAAFVAAAPRTILLAGAFAGDPAPAPPPLHAFEPIGPGRQRQILDALDTVAGYWRSGDGDGIMRWMKPYLDDYVRAYPLESASRMEERVRRMVAAFSSEKVEFDRNQTLLDPVPGSNLVDCLGPRGAAVRIARAGAPDYDMWAVVGIRGGEVVLVR